MIVIGRFVFSSFPVSVSRLKGSIMVKVPAKKSVKIVKAGPKSAKARAKSKSNPVPKKPRDDARAVAVASDGKLTTDQVRVLRTALRPCRMVQIKAAFGLSPEQKYSGKFLSHVHQLIHAKLLLCYPTQDSRAFEYHTTPKGKLALGEATKEAQAIARVKAKG